MGCGGGGGGSSSKLKKAVQKIFVETCGSLCRRQQTHVLDNSTAATAPVCRDSPNNSSPVEIQKRNVSCKKISSEITGQGISSTSPSSDKNLCAICLDPLSYSSGSSAGQAIFTAQCSHAFHFACISSNVRHGSVTCPICRAQWTQLPRNLNTWCSLHSKTDPVLQILDDSIANLRVHRRSFLRSARYDDDDPIEPNRAGDQSRLCLSLLNVPLTCPNFSSCPHQASGSGSCPCCESLSHQSSGSSSVEESPLAALQPGPSVGETPYLHFPNDRAYLQVKLSHQPATDLVLVASPNGPHLRLMKQAMALAVFSLRPTDRLAIVTYSSAAARVFPLRCMTSYGKRSALQVIDRLFYMGQADPTEGLRKGVKILGDRVHKNPHSCILHLTDSPSRSYHWFDTEVPVPILRFHVGYGFGTSNGFFMHEFEEFLARTLSGGVKDLQLRIGEGSMVVGIGELRGGEERSIPLYIGESEHVCVEYSYRDGERIRRGEIVVGLEDKRDTRENADEVPVGARMSSAENWGYRDPFMARRWAKHLHGYRL